MNDTKQYIMNVALQLFLQKGFKAVTINDILHETKLSKGGFYHHFESKEKLFEEISYDIFQSMPQYSISDFSNYSLKEFYTEIAQNSIMQIIQQKLSASHIDNTKENSINFYFMMFDAINIIPEFQKTLSEHLDKEMNLWINVIANAKQKGEIKTNLSNEEIAKLFIRSADGNALNIIMYNMNAKIDTMELWNSIYSCIKS